MNTVLIYYAITFILSFVLSAIYVYQWHKHFDVNITVTFLIIPVVNLSYYLMAGSDDSGIAIFALKLIYIGGCFLPWFLVMCVLNLCKIPIRRGIRLVTFLISSFLYSCVLTIGHTPIFYRSMSRIEENGAWVMVKEYGPMHTLFYAVVLVYLIVNFIIIIYTYKEKKQVSRRILLLLIFPVLATMIGYFANSILRHTGIELIPIGYLAAQVTYLFIADRMVLYDVSDMVVDSLVESGNTGFVTVDLKDNYLDSNNTAKRIFPKLAALEVDRSILTAAELKDNIISWIYRFQADSSDSRSIYVRPDPEGGGEERIYVVNVDYLYDGRRRRGYQVFLEDDTKNQKYIKLLDKYNLELQDEVNAKTKRIIEMHDNLILSMATMVESRDNSTGGHIRRTSEGVRILIEEIMKSGKLNLSEEFCRDIIKAAPMHDLGKIAVDDAILRKPGRYTPEEYEKMKAHAPEGARIVHEILKDTDDSVFREIAENVAHYHHERVDGSGYPDGKKGDEIPIEARIMAIADVYDALVSKRVYKEEFSFEKADRIILEGMGTQFDKSLQEYYKSARPKLEEYYRNDGDRSLAL